MRIEKLRACNFRSLKDVEVTFDDLTVLVGANSSGKTSVLEALRLFGDDHVKLSGADFFPGSAEMEVEVTIDPEGAGGVPREYLEGGKIVVQAVCELEQVDKGRIVRIKKMCNRDLADIRDIRVSRDRQAKMKSLVGKYPNLPYRGAWPDALNSYEREHLDDPKHEYEARFIGLDQSEFGSGGLLDIMYVPAARDLEADARDGGGTVLSDLIDMTVRRSGERDARLQKIMDEANRGIVRLMRGANRDAAGLAGKISERTAPYVDNTEVRLEFGVPGIQNASPRATLTLVEDGMPIPMDRAGSGLQRVYLMALLETIYALGDAGAGGKDAKVRLVLIDEPELYQHPQRQRRILSALGRLAAAPGVQVACSTHSPYFVWLEEIGRVRRLQKAGRQTAVCKTTMDRIVESVNSTEIHRPVDAVRMTALLDMVSSRWITEGLFARLVVLVEGPGDRSMLLATARAMGIPLDGLEIAIVPCEGKANMPHVFQVFSHLGVPTYLVWDVDPKVLSEHDRRLNHGLQKLADPKTPDGQDPKKAKFAPRYSCPSPNLSVATTRAVENYSELLTERMDYYGLDSKDGDERKKAIHNQRIVCEILTVVRGNRRRFGALPTVRILRRVVRMREGISGRDAPGPGGAAALCADGQQAPA